jgi:hypothetical protein
LEEQGILTDVWRFFRFVPILVLIIVIGVAASYLVWGSFTFRAYSTRLFWAGIGAAALGAIAIVASLGSYSTMGVTNVFTASGDAPIATQRTKEYMQMNAKRHRFIFRMATGVAICIGPSALIEVLTR